MGDIMHSLGRSLPRAAALALALVAVPCDAARASGESGPQLAVTAISLPTNFAPASEARPKSYEVTVVNAGDEASDGTPITVTDELPPGLTLDPSGATALNNLAVSGFGLPTEHLTCAAASCTYTGILLPSQTLTFKFPVDVTAGAPSSVVNVVRVAGGGAPQASVSTPTAITSAPASFGLAPGGSRTTLSSLQAGAHADLTTSLAFNTVDAEGALAQDTKTTSDALPAGFAGDLVDTPSCAPALFIQSLCPIGTQVGIATLTIVGLDGGVHLEPVYNLTAEPGEVAKLGLLVAENVRVEASVRVEPDYSLGVAFTNINQADTELDNVTLTTWGVPASPIHDPLRWNRSKSLFGVPGEGSPAPFLTNPTFCDVSPLEAVLAFDSWQEPGRELEGRMPFGPMQGCDRLRLEAKVAALPTTGNASSASGLALGMEVPQTYDNPAGLTTATLKKAVVTLPEGVTVNPSGADGMAACTEAEYRGEPVEPGGSGGCPSASTLGTVRIASPSIKEEATGTVYLAQPYANPFNSLLAVYVVARVPARGILIKAAGQVSLDPLTGRIVTTFDDLPPLPFSKLTFTLRQGPTAPLVTPPHCGTYTIRAQLTPASDPGGRPVSPLIQPFSIGNGVGGGLCPSDTSLPFQPELAAGTRDNKAGAFGEMDIRLARSDGEQEITGISTQMPPGLTADLTGVAFCPEAAIALARSKTGTQEEAEPSCPAGSAIGRTLVGAGVGSTLVYTPGKLYFAGPDEGAPFSVVSITSAKVGPFDLGTVVVRLPLDVSPLTAAVTVRQGTADQIPHIIKGIVVHVRDVRVYVDRPGFVENPTSCAPMAFGVTVFGSGANFASALDDQAAPLASPFQAADCRGLGFTPTIKVTTAAQSSKARGASLNVQLTYPAGSQTTQTNLRFVKVDLPIQLPSRLTTLQKACLDKVFAANPASCPAASIVGHATASTPLLPVPLSGPAYFVSHGNAKFPELVIVLQGYGVRIDLHGETFISKKGITSSTFSAVPDQPVSRFDLTLPQGPFSALGANLPRKARGSFCGRRLVMPTKFIAQDGATIRRNTVIGVTGCRKHKAIRRRGRRHRRKRAAHRKSG